MAVDNQGEFGVEIRDAPPAHLLMKIESFSVLSKHGVQKHQSREFVAGNYKWRFIIHPQVLGGNDISVYMSVSDTKSLPEGWEVKANCSILLHNQISNKYLCFHGKERRFDATNSSWGFSISKKMVLEPSNGFLVDDSCVFGAEVIVSKTTAAVECLSLIDLEDFTLLQIGKCQLDYFSSFRCWRFPMMKLYPSGNGGAKGKRISVYLECVESKAFALHEKVEADFCIRIKNKLPHAHKFKYSTHRFSSSSVDWGFTHFFPIADLRDPGNGFIVDYCCVLEAEISEQDAV